MSRLRLNPIKPRSAVQGMRRSGGDRLDSASYVSPRMGEGIYRFVKGPGVGKEKQSTSSWKLTARLDRCIDPALGARHDEHAKSFTSEFLPMDALLPGRLVSEEFAQKR